MAFLPTETAKRRYARQVILPEMGEAGQRKLAQAKILVVGAGGLGSPSLLYLAAAGIGKLGIIDHDRVDLSNLQRQILFETGDIGRHKTEAAADALTDLNPEIQIQTYAERLTAENAAHIIGAYDLVVDGSDNIETRFMVHDACFVLRKPLVTAAVLGFEGQISTFKSYLGGTHPCYRCLYPEPPPADAMPTCAENGIMGAVTGVLGAMQAGEAIKEVAGIGKGLSGILLQVNLLTMEFRRTYLKPDPECKLCAHTQ